MPFLLYSGDARYMEKIMRERLEKFDLELHPAKTRIIKLDKGA